MSIEDMNMDEKRILAQSVVNLLNDLLQCDQKAIEALVEHRVPCNERMHNRPNILLGVDGLGALGLINSIIGTVEEGPRKGWGLIMAIFNNDNKLIHFTLTDEKLEES